MLAALAIAVAIPLATSEITVQRGQTLSGIAKEHHVSVARLAAFNGISNPNFIIAGQVLRIPPAEGSESATDSPPPSRFASDSRPPWASTISRARARPRPVPLRLVE